LVVIIDVVDWTTKFTTLHIKSEIYSNVPPLSDVPKVTINLTVRSCCKVTVFPSKKSEPSK